MFLAIDWTDAAITALHVRTTAGSIAIEGRLSAPWPGDADSPEALAGRGEWLRGELRRAGLPLMPAVICAPRRRGFLKLLEVPPVGGDLLADVVRSQAEHRMGAEAHGAAIDFLILPHRDSANLPLQTVLAAALSGETLRQIRGVLVAAAIPVRAIGFGELGLPALPSLDPSDRGAASSLRLDLLCDPDRVELVLSYDGFPLASQSLAGADDSGTDRDRAAATRWLATAERMRLSLPEGVRREAIGEIVVRGSTATSSLAPLRAASPVPVRHEAGDSEEGLRCLAYLASLQHPATAIDFENPRRVADPRAARRRMWRRAGLWAAAVATPLAIWFQQERSALDRELERLRQEERDRTAWIERGRPLVAAAEFLDRWDASRTDWGAQLTDLLPRLPSDERGYLERLQLEHRESSAASIQVSGLASSADEIAQLNTALVRQNDRYELQPRAIEPNSLDSDFQVRFHTDLALRPRPIDDQTDETAADASERRRGEAP